MAMLTEEDRAQLVERIQRATAHRTWEERLQIAEAWEFMASEVRRLHASALLDRSQLAPPPYQQLQLELVLS